MTELEVIKLNVPIGTWCTVVPIGYLWFLYHMVSTRCFLCARKFYHE